jgi:hypothetical protein
MSENMSDTLRVTGASVVAAGATALLVIAPEMWMSTEMSCLASSKTAASACRFAAFVSVVNAWSASIGAVVLPRTVSLYAFSCVT